MKQTHCLHCGETIEVPDEIVDGQHILCPYCNKKFSYSNVKSVSNNVSSFGGNWKKLLLPIGLIAIAVVLVVVKLHFFPGDETKLKKLTDWYESTLNYNRLFEQGYGEEQTPCGLMFILAFHKNQYIRWFPQTGELEYPRSMAKGFAQDLIMARITIEELRIKLHRAKKSVGHNRATVINLPEGLTEEEAKEYLRKMDAENDR